MIRETRKEREYREREARMLDLAREMLMRDGYLGLNMERIASAVEYSKGTVYGHFPNKEEIILALAVETQKKRTEMFQRGAVFHGSSRDRITAIGAAAELFVRLHPSHFHVEQIVRLSSIWEKTSEKRRQIMRNGEMACVGVVGGVVRDAVARGELNLPEEVSPEDVVFGLWSTNFGAFTLLSTSNSLVDLGIENPVVAVRTCMNRMLDGFAWQPISSEFDYEAVYQRAMNEVFPDEYSQLQALG